MKIPQNETLEDAVFKWFTQERTDGFLMSSFVAREKAPDFNLRPGGSPDFKASEVCRENFKLRHGIRAEALFNIPGFEECDIENVVDWLRSDG